MGILAAWPLIKWGLQALGFMGPEDREKERDYKMRLLEAAEKRDASLIEAWARFQASQTSFERIYKVVVGSMLFYDVAFGPGRSIQRARELTEAGIAGLFVLAVLLFPFYGAALVSGVGKAFESAVGAAANKINGGRPTSGGGGGGAGSPVIPSEPAPINYESYDFGRTRNRKED